MGNIKQQIDQLPGEAETHLKRTGYPLVTLSFAQSLDGSLTLEPGKPSPVSGESSMYVTHQLRGAHDTILVGVGTVIADNPRLTARGAGGTNPRPIIADSKLRTPVTAAVLSNPQGLIIATTAQASVHRREALENAGATIWTLQSNPVGRVSLSNLLEKLGSINVSSLMVEGGSHIISSFLREQLADRVVITIAPVFAGGYHAVQNLGETTWQALPRISDTALMKTGDDIIVWGKIVK